MIPSAAPGVRLASGLRTPGRLDPDGFSEVMASHRIHDLDEVAGYIEAIDFTELKCNMSTRLGGHGWPAEQCSWAEDQYKKWLFLRRKHENQLLSPNTEIDKFWHEHILDTRAYFRDTARIFGYYQHHFPYFGARGDADLADLRAVWANTCRLFKREFGAYPTQFADRPANPPCTST
jgi:hypothetical protein